MRAFIVRALFEALRQGGVLFSAVRKGLDKDCPEVPDDMIEEEVKKQIAGLLSGSSSPSKGADDLAPSVPVYPIAPPNWPENSTHCLAVGSLRAFGRASRDDAGFVVIAGSEFSGLDDPTISTDNYRDIWLEVRTSDAFSEGSDGKLISAVDIEFSSAALAATVVRAVNGKTEDWEDALRHPLKSRGRGGSPRYTIREQASAAISPSDGAEKASIFAASAASAIAMQASAPQLELSMPGSTKIQSKGRSRAGKRRGKRRR